MRLYITGVKSQKDAEEAVQLGSAAVGIKMGYGKDDVHPELARDIFFSLPVFISRVGVFIDEKRYHIQELVTFCRLDTLHFLGREKPDDIKRYPEHVLKSFPENELFRVKDYHIQGVIVQLNSGIFMDQEAETIISPPLILSGNLTLKEWETALQKYRPYGIHWDLSLHDREVLAGLLLKFR